MNNDNIIFKIIFSMEEYQKINEIICTNPLEDVPKHVYLETIIKAWIMELIETAKNNRDKHNYHEFLLNNETENKLQAICLTWEKIGKIPLTQERLFQKLILNEWFNNRKFYEYEQKNFNKMINNTAGAVINE